VIVRRHSRSNCFWRRQPSTVWYYTRNTEDQNYFSPGEFNKTWRKFSTEASLTWNNKRGWRRVPEDLVIQSLYPGTMETRDCTCMSSSRSSSGIVGCLLNIENCLVDIPCSLADIYRRFGGTCCLHLQSRREAQMSHCLTVFSKIKSYVSEWTGEAAKL
jgi:hypothetical protein